MIIGSLRKICTNLLLRGVACMSLADLLQVLRRNIADYLLWLIAYLGGIIITLLSGFTIWVIHAHSGVFNLGCEVYLMTGTVTLAVTGLSYFRFQKNSGKGIQLNRLITYSWPILLMAVYGLLISMGFEKSPRSPLVVWVICVSLFVFLMIWSTIIWLHEQGLREESQKEPEETQLDDSLRDAAESLPKRKQPGPVEE